MIAAIETPAEAALRLVEEFEAGRISRGMLDYWMREAFEVERTAARATERSDVLMAIEQWFADDMDEPPAAAVRVLLGVFEFIESGGHEGCAS